MIYILEEKGQRILDETFVRKNPIITVLERQKRLLKDKYSEDIAF